MEEIILIRPSQKLKEQALEYKEEHIENGERELHGGALLGSMPFDEWLQLTLENSDPETVHFDWVVSDTFFVVRLSDLRIIGMVDFRHDLNAFLASYGGHIGYGVRPLERHKGYGTAILQKILTYAKNLGYIRVMLACYKENEASRRTILANGGVLDREFCQIDGRQVEIYWINL